MRCFWAKGYEATSTRELAAQMGMTGASLYNAFGDKKSLYKQSLEHYLRHSVRDRIRRLDAIDNPLHAIGAFFDEIIERSVTDRQRRGCMLVNSAMELAPHDDGFRKLVSQELTHIESFFRRRVKEAQGMGSIATQHSAAALAKMLLSVLLGIRVLARARPQRALLEAAAHIAIASLTIRG